MAEEARIGLAIRFSACTLSERAPLFSGTLASGDAS